MIVPGAMRTLSALFRHKCFRGIALGSELTGYIGQKFRLKGNQRVVPREPYESFKDE
jgi:hypothetical protein